MNLRPPSSTLFPYTTLFRSYDKFVRFKHLLVAGLSGHSDEMLRRNLYPRGAKVLDVGCGFGDSTIKIARSVGRSEEHTSELQSQFHLVCRLLLEKKKFISCN